MDNQALNFHSQAFNSVFQRSIVSAQPSDVIKERVESLIDNVTFNTFMYTSRGLFENDKLTFTAQVYSQ